MRRKAARWIVPALLILLWVSWTVVLIQSKQPFSLQGSNDNPFSTWGSFGDSFGPIASLMATLAAVSAYRAFTSDRDDKSLQRFEHNFFTLLSNFESIVSQFTINIGKYKQGKVIDYHRLDGLINRKIKRELSGRNSLKAVLYSLRAKIGPSGYNNIKVVSQYYDYEYDKWVGLLGHYFRTLYHIYRLIDDQCPGDKVYYARIIRAHLSNDELCLIAYNCIVGEGRHKFRRLVDKYAVLHNLHARTQDIYELSELRFFTSKLPATAFRFEAHTPLTFND